MAGGSCLGLLLAALMDLGECRTRLLWRLKKSGGSPLVSGNQPSCSGMDKGIIIGSWQVQQWAPRRLPCGASGTSNVAYIMWAMPLKLTVLSWYSAEQAGSFLFAIDEPNE